MKYLLFLVITIAFDQSVTAQKKTIMAAKPVAVIKAANTLKNYRDTASYALGFNIGESVKARYKGIDTKVLIQALQDAVNNKTALLDASMTPAIMNKYAYNMAKATGDAFLQENKKRKNIVVTPSGLQYEILKQGDGTMPTATSTVKVHYVGTYTNGKEFESSVKNGAPIEFGVNGVIAGWTEALKLMKVGSKYKLYIPQNLAYGEYGKGNIGPGEALIFEVELLAITQQ